VPLVVGLLAATATWPVYEVFLRLPGLRLMFVLRYATWAALAGPAIAAFEADRLVRDLKEGRRRTALLGGLAILAFLGALLLWVQGHYAPLHAAAGGAAAQRHAAWLAIAVLGTTGVAILAGAFRPRILPALPILLAAVAAAELGAQGMRLYRFGSPGDLFPETPMIGFLRSRPGPFRIAGEGAVFFPNSNVFAGLEDIRTHDPVEREDYVDFLDRAAGYPPADYFKHLTNFNAPALDLLNVRYLAGEPGWPPPGPKWKPAYSGMDGVVFENADALPRVFGGARAGAALRHAPDGFTVSDYAERTNRVSFRIRVERSTAPAVTAVASLVQDGGWTASEKADGSRPPIPIPLGRAEGLLVSMSLPPGDHDIVLRYRPLGFRIGVGISMATAAAAAAAAAAAVLLSLRDRRRRRPPGSRELRPG